MLSSVLSTEYWNETLWLYSLLNDNIRWYHTTLQSTMWLSVRLLRVDRVSVHVQGGGNSPSLYWVDLCAHRGETSTGLSSSEGRMNVFLMVKRVLWQEPCQHWVINLEKCDLPRATLPDQATVPDPIRGTQPLTHLKHTGRESVFLRKMLPALFCLTPLV